MSTKVEVHFANGEVQEYVSDIRSMLRRVDPPPQSLLIDEITGSFDVEFQSEEARNAVRALYKMGEAFGVFVPFVRRIVDGLAALSAFSEKREELRRQSWQRRRTGRAIK